MVNLEKKYSEFYKNINLKGLFPNEYITRIFKGTYPRLNLKEAGYSGKKILDIGFGDGRNFLLLNQLDLELYGIEITEEICEKVKNELSKINIKAFLKQGKNLNIPFNDDFFDFLLTWNSCYYMGEKENFIDDFSLYLNEYSRVLKNEGKLILSIPQKSSFIFNDSLEIKKGFRLILKDPYEIRNNHVLRCFENIEEIKDIFSSYFKNFIVATLNDDCFGQNNHWFLIVCYKK